MKTTNLENLKIHKLSRAQYQHLIDTDQIDETALYMVPEETVDLSSFATTEEMEAAIAAIPQSDWNQNDETAKDYIKNKPFGEVATGGDTLTWDGVVGDRYFVPSGGGQFVHMSDSVPTKADVANGIVMHIPSNELALEGSQVQAMFAENGFAMLETVVIIPTDNYVVDDAITFKKKGVYFVLFGEMYTELFTINGYTGFPSVATIDEKYIPDTIARIEDIPTKTSELTNDSDFATVANIPTNVSQLTNDSGYLTEHQDISGKANVSDLTAHTDNTTAHITDDERAAWNAKSNFSGDYNDLTNKPTIPTVPTNVSAFTNDAGYLTSHQDISGKADITYVDSQDAATLGSANTYTDEKIANLLNNSTEAVDSVMELAAAMETNKDAIDALTEISGKKVDKVEGKGLSTNDYTDDEAEKLAGIEVGAQVNVQSDWCEVDTESSAYIHNRPFYENITYENLYTITNLTFADYSVNEETGQAIYAHLFSDASFVLEEGATYIVEWPDFSTECVGIRVNETTVAVGNYALMDPASQSDSDEPFYIATDTSGACTVLCTLADPIAETPILKVLSEVQQLDEKFIPDTIARTSDLPQITTGHLIMSAANWDVEAQTYSFENMYPAAEYDIELDIDGDVITVEQLDVFNGARMVSSATTNVVKAFGEVPTVDIPVILKVQVK